MSNRVKKILIERDGISDVDADNRIADFLVEFNSAIASCESLETFEELVMDHFGLEPDYVEDFLMGGF